MKVQMTRSGVATSDEEISELIEISPTCSENMKSRSNVVAYPHGEPCSSKYGNTYRGVR